MSRGLSSGMSQWLLGVWAVVAWLTLSPAAAPARAAEPEKAAASKPAATTQAAVPDWVFAEDEMAGKKDGKAAEPAGPLKVGVVISRFTATGPHWAGAPYGYSHANVAQQLVSPDVQLFALLEPETESDGDLATALAEFFPPDVPKLDAHDPAALKTLDVIVAQRVANMNDEMIAAISEAVGGGVGLVVSQTFGTVTPGYRPAICDMLGLDDATYGFHATPVACEVTATDPILAGTEAAGTEWQAQPSGTLGRPREGVTPLVKVGDIDSVEVVMNRGGVEGRIWPMLYFWRHGNGPVIVNNFKELPDPLKTLEGDNFFLRCVKRAAAMRK